MRNAAILLMMLAFGFASCSREPDRTVTHCGRDGRPDQWVYRIDKDTYKIAVDTNARLIDSDAFGLAGACCYGRRALIAFLSHILKMRLRPHWLKVADPKGTQQ